jgi:DNA-binding CsgD family transcriptional regulator
MIHGEAGIGKTALLEHAGTAAGDMTVLRVVGVRGEADVSLAGLLELVRPEMRRIDGLPAPQARALRAALALEDPPAGGLDRFAVAAAVLSLLAAVAEDAGVLVLVDDLQWVDRASAEAILFAARRLASDRAAFLLAVRDGEELPVDLAGIASLEISGLDPAASTALAERVHGGTLSPELAAAVFAISHGNPLAIRELRDLDAAALPTGAVPVSRLIESAYGARAAALVPGARLALLTVAADDAVDAATVLEVLAMLGVGVEGVRDGEAAGLLVRRGDRVAFRHPLVRSAVFQQATDADRRRVHAALAEALPSAAARDRRVLHRAAAATGPDDPLAGELEVLATAAATSHAYAVAAAAAQRAAELATRPLRARCLLTAARARWLGGETERATAALRSALEACDDPLLRADIERLQAEVLWNTGHLDQAAELLVGGARAVAGRDRDRAATMLEQAGHAAMLDGNLEIAIGATDEALRLGGGQARGAGGARGLPKARALVLTGRFDAAVPLYEEALAATAGSDDPLVVSASSDWAGWMCRYDEAYRRAVRAVELARNQGSPVATTKALQVALDQATIAGNLRAALVYGDEGIEIATETGQQTMVVWCHWSIGAAAAWRGDGRRLAGAVAAMEGVGRPLTWGAVRDASALVRGIGHLAADEPEAAAQALDGATDLDAEQVGNVPLTGAFDFVEALFKAGRTAASEQALDRVALHAHQPWAAASALRSRGLHGGGGEGDAFFGGALAMVEHQQSMVELARTQLLYGQWLRRHRRRIDAREQLRAALAAFERMGADPFAAQALRELAASGETHAVRREGRPIDTLTPQEWRVASLAADGLANRDIAQRLFLSPKTIEAHLHRVFQKLRVERRSQLAAALGDTARDPGSGGGDLRSPTGNR